MLIKFQKILDNAIIPHYAQMLIQKVERAEIEEVKELSETKRGAGGFGSTGLFKT